jgi:hypothetical protein
MTLKFVPLDLKTANEFVAKHHRHNDPTNGHKFSIGLSDDGELKSFTQSETVFGSE